MAGGQQIDSGQGTVTAIPGGISVTGEASSSGVGSAVSGIVLSLRSRKVGGGSSTRALTGSAISHAVGSFGVVPQFPVLGISATGSLGAFGKTRAVAQAGSVSSVEQGSVTGPSGSSALSTNFQITSNVGGSNLPFSLGYAFRQGDVLSGQIATTTDTSNWQCRPMSYWPDGSVRHAIIAGRKTLTAGVAATITLSAGTDPGGTALTESNLSSALPTTVIDAGGFSWTLNSSIGTADRFKTVCTGPVMSYWVYRKPVAGSNHLVLWCEVKLYVGGNVELFPWVENAYLDVAGATNDIRTYTLTVGGVTRFNAVNLDIKHHTRIPLLNTGTGEGSSHSFSHWTGSDPQITPKHNMAYLKATKIVPNYGTTAPGAGFMSGLTTTYTPNTTCGISILTSAGNTGGIFGCGAVQADPAYITSGGDIAAYRAMIVFGLSSGSWYTHQRESSGGNANEPLKFTNTGTLSFQSGNIPNAGGTGGENAQLGSNGPCTHSPAWGTMAWLMTGRWWFADEMAFWSNYQYLYNPTGFRQGSSGVLLSSSSANTERGAAWALRQLGQCAALLPDSHPSKADYVASWAANVAWYYSAVIAGGNPNHGSDYVNNLGWFPGSTNYGTFGPFNLLGQFQHMMIAAVFGYVWDLAPSMTATASMHHLSVRDHGYKLPVGMTSPTGSSGWDYRWFGDDKIPGQVTATGQFFTSWADAYSQVSTFMGTGPVGSSLQTFEGSVWGAALGSEYLTTYFGNHTMALAYAASHVFPGAQLGWNRVTSASNWTSYTAAFNNNPINYVSPLAVELPSWLPAVGQIANVSLNTIVSVATGADADKADRLYIAWSGIAHAPWWGKLGKFSASGGGHSDGDRNADYTYDIQTRSWVKEKAGATSFLFNNYNADSVTGWMFANTSGSVLQVGEPGTGHFYCMRLILPEAAMPGQGALNGWLYTPSRTGFANGGSAGTNQAHKRRIGIDATWTLQGGPYSDGSTNGLAIYDSRRRRVWFTRVSSNASTLYYRDLATGTQGSLGISATMVGSWYYCAGDYYEPEDLLIAVYSDPGGGAGIPYIRLVDAGTGTVYTPSISNPGAAPAYHGRSAWSWSSHWRVIVCYPGSGQTVGFLKAPDNMRTGSWVWSTQTLGGSAYPSDGVDLSNPAYNRIQHVPSIGNALLWFPSPSGPVQAFSVTPP